MTSAQNGSGSTSDRSFDLINQARIGVQLQRAYFADTSLLPTGKTLAMITIDAAKALAMDAEIGSLEPGKRADVICLTRVNRTSRRKSWPRSGSSTTPRTTT